MPVNVSPSGTAAAAQGKTDILATSPIEVTTLRESTSSGSGCIRGLYPTDPVPTAPLAHYASPTPLSFFAPTPSGPKSEMTIKQPCNVCRPKI